MKTRVKNKLQIEFWIAFMLPASIIGFLVEMTRIGYSIGKNYVADYMEKIGS